MVYLPADERLCFKANSVFAKTSKSDKNVVAVGLKPLGYDNPALSLDEC